MDVDDEPNVKRPYIKKVVIHGFLSYGDQGDIDEFDPGMNVLVGLNGAGKSNFLAAICFVMGHDKYFRMTAEERKQLLHRGPGDTVISGYVELHMENMGDNVALGLPSDVIVRRTVGLKKDEYSLNSKRADKEDVINLFETIGFSRSNPYNIVLQGQVDRLTAMSAMERLELIKDIAGASLYDEKRAESTKLLDETKEKMTKVDDVIATLDQRIADLEQDKEELSNFQTADKMRRALEHRLRDLEMVDVERHLAKIDASRVKLTEFSKEAHNKTVKMESDLETEEAELKKAALDVDRFGIEKTEKSAEIAALTEQLGRVQLELNDHHDVTSNRAGRQKSIETELKQVKKEVNEAQKRLQSVMQEFTAASDAEAKIKTNFETKDRRAKELYAKQGRITQYKTKAERDKGIRKEMEDLGKTIEARRKQTSTLEGDIATLEATIKSLDTTIKSRATRQESLLREAKEQTASYEKAKASRDLFAEKRKEDWRRLKELEDLVQQKKSELLTERRSLESTMTRDLVAGLDAVSKIRLPAGHTIYGPLMDLITVDEGYETAVEVTAGNALFHVVVDTDETAGMVLRGLNNARMGRVTCIPLNKVLPKNKVGDLEVDQDSVTKLPDVIHYNAIFQPAILQLFGKTLVCQSLDLASRLSLQHKVACVTLDGNQVSIKGALTGGFHDDRVSRLRAAKRMHDLTEQIQTHEQDIQSLQKNLTGVEERITAEIKKMADIDRRRGEAIHSLETFSASTRTAHVDLMASRTTLEKRIQSNKDNESTISSMKETITSLESEISSGLFSKLSAEESAELQKLNVELDSLGTQLTKATTTRAEKQAVKTELESSLDGNLLPRLAELESDKASLENIDFLGTKTAQSITSLEKDHSTAKNLLTKLQGELDTIQQRLADSKTLVDQKQRNVDDIKAKLADAQVELAGRTKEQEKMFASRATFVTKRDDLLKRIRDIGSLSSAATEKVATMTPEECAHELKGVKETLAGMTGINKKAMDQFLSYSEEKERFDERKEQMQAEYEAIENLMTQLDAQKEEAIHRTFQAVAVRFTQVFKEVVPGGNASLLMRVSTTSEDYLSQDPDTQQLVRGGKEQTVGIDLKVTFPGHSTKDGTAIRALSGGQRTITALSLIFAIQRCDPAPFYIFDEIDPALDDRYRRAVAELIEKQAKKMQFLIVTHRKEMVESAHKNYAITFSNRVSHVEPVDTEAALEVVAQALNDEKTKANRAEAKKKKKQAPVEKPATMDEEDGDVEKKSTADGDDDDEEEARYAPRDADDDLLHGPEEPDIIDRPKRREKRALPK